MVFSKTQTRAIHPGFFIIIPKSTLIMMYRLVLQRFCQPYKYTFCSANVTEAVGVFIIHQFAF